MVTSNQHFYHFYVYQGVAGSLAALCGSVHEIWDWPLVQGSVLVGFFEQSECDGVWGLHSKVQLGAGLLPPRHKQAA